MLQESVHRVSSPCCICRQETGNVTSNKRLPEICSFSSLVRAHHIPGLIANLDVPVSVLLSVLSVSVPLLLDELTGLWVLHGFASIPLPLFVLATTPGLPGLPWLGHRACAPWPDLQAVHALLRLAGVGLAHLELGEVGTAGASKLWRRDHVPGAVLQAAAAGPGALGPGRELRHDAVLLARDEAGLFQEGLGLKVLADDVLCGDVLVLLDAGYLSHLDAFLSLHTFSSFLQAFGNHGLTLIPGSQPPVVQLFVPVTHFETVLLVTGSPSLLAVRMQCCPAFHVSTPHSPGLDAAWSTVISHTPSPGTYKSARVS